MMRAATHTYLGLHGKLLAQPLAPVVEEERHWYENKSNESQQAISPAHAEVLIKRRSRKGQKAAHQIAQERDGGKGGCCSLGPEDIDHVCLGRRHDDDAPRC